MTETKIAPIRRVYPREGSNAATILDFILRTPEVTTNGVINGLSMNPSTVRKCLKVLLERDKITDEPDGDGNHHYTAKGPAL